MYVKNTYWKLKCLLEIYGFRKVYDGINNEKIWHAHGMHGLDWNLLDSVKIFYNGSKDSIRMENKLSEWFPEREGLG